MGQFRPWGLEHVAILMSVIAVSAGLAAVTRENRRRSSQSGVILALLLVSNEVVWWLYRYGTEGVHVWNLPLQLCDLSVWAAALAAGWRWQTCFEFAYFAGLAGSGIALVTPDLWAPWPSYPSLYYFLSHGLTIVIVLFLVWGVRMRLTPWAMGRFLLVVNCYAVLISAFNAVFQTNYLYLCRRPEAATLLDHLGPWPWYLVFGEVVAIALTALLSLPLSADLRSRLAGRLGV